MSIEMTNEITSHQQPRIYAIPGLAMQQGIFARLSLKLGPIHPVNWLEPQASDESFDGYCQRMAAQMDTRYPIILIGMSFGGIVATRISQMIPIHQLILISSLKASTERPPIMSLGKYFPVYKLSTESGRTRTAKLWGPLFGLDDEETLDLCLPMFNAHSKRYWNWGVEQVIKWENETYPDHILHLHGDKDLIFPDRYLGAHVRIPGGDHFMVYKQAIEISEHINAVLAERISL